MIRVNRKYKFINANNLATVLKSFEKKRIGGRHLRKIGTKEEHSKFIKNIIDEQSTFQYDELCALFRARFKINVSRSTMYRFIRFQLNITRKRVQKALPKQSAKSVDLRKRFVGQWFQSTDLNTIGTKDEQENQKHWKLDIESCARARNRRCRKTDSCRHITDTRQLFFVDETGCNKHTLLRKYGLSQRGKPAYVAKHDASKGNNHSVIIAVGVAGGIIAHKTLVKRARATRRDDFCQFLTDTVAPAMLRVANKCNLAANAPLYLLMDNASIHKGVVVSNALRKVSCLIDCMSPINHRTCQPSIHANRSTTNSRDTCNKEHTHNISKNSKNT